MINSSTYATYANEYLELLNKYNEFITLFVTEFSNDKNPHLKCNNSGSITILASEVVTSFDPYMEGSRLFGRVSFAKKDIEGNVIIFAKFCFDRLGNWGECKAPTHLSLAMNSGEIRTKLPSMVLTSFLDSLPKA